MKLHRNEREAALYRTHRDSNRHCCDGLCLQKPGPGTCPALRRPSHEPAPTRPAADFPGGWNWPGAVTVFSSCLLMVFVIGWLVSLFR